MRRLARQLFTALALLLCLAVCALWWRSATTFDHLRWRYAVDVTPHERDERSLHAISVEGRLFLATSREEFFPYPPWDGWTGPHPSVGLTWATSSYRPGWWNFEKDLDESFQKYGRRLGGLGSVSVFSLTNHGGPHRRIEALAVPHGVVALLLALPALSTVVRRWRRGRLHRVGHCPTCGYDLRASPDRCPECGQTVMKLQQVEQRIVAELQPKARGRPASRV